MKRSCLMFPQLVQNLDKDWQMNIIPRETCLDLNSLSYMKELSFIEWQGFSLRSNLNHYETLMKRDNTLSRAFLWSFIHLMSSISQRVLNTRINLCLYRWTTSLSNLPNLTVKTRAAIICKKGDQIIFKEANRNWEWKDYRFTANELTVPCQSPR